MRVGRMQAALVISLPSPTLLVHLHLPGTRTVQLILVKPHHSVAVLPHDTSL